MFSLLGASAGIVASSTVGDRRIDVPGARTPLSFEDLAILICGVIVVSVTRSAMSDLERLASVRLHVYVGICSAVLFAVSAGGLSLVSLWRDGGLSCGAIVGSVGFYVLLGVLSMFVFGLERAWVLGLSVLFPFQFLDQLAEGNPAWWNWPALIAQGGDVGRLVGGIVTFIVVAAGVRLVLSRTQVVRRFIVKLGA